VREEGAAIRALAVSEIDVGVLGRILRIAVADLEVTSRSIAAVDEVVAVLRAGRETRARARGENLLAWSVFKTTSPSTT